MTQAEQMLSATEAWRIIVEHIRPLEQQRVALDGSAGSVLAEDLRADSDYPPFDRAMMDGFAVRGADCAAGSVWLVVAGELAAGDVPSSTIAPGHAVHINTGAAVPAGADAVVMVEQTRMSEDGKRVWIGQPVQPEQNIARQGSDRTAGQVVLQAGRRLGEAQISVAAAIGAGEVPVYRRPRVAVLATGSELVSVDESVRPGQIRNSNGPCLTALARRIGYDCQNLGIVVDDREQLRRRMVEGLAADVFCLTGGISMGQYDLVPEVLESLGVEIHLRKVAIKPGKPTLFGSTRDGRYVFGLPGNPVSCFLIFLLFVEPALGRLEGLASDPPQPVPAKLRGRIGRTKDRDSYMPVRWRFERDGGITVEPVEYHGSADAFALAQANGLVVRPARAAAAGDGDQVLVIPFWWQR